MAFYARQDGARYPRQDQKNRRGHMEDVQRPVDPGG